MRHRKTDDAPAALDEAREPQTDDEQPQPRLRLYILVGLLSTLCLVYGLTQVDQWLLRRELAKLAVELADEFNESNPLPVGDEPQVGTDCTITAAREYLVFGKATGKITFRFTKRAVQPEEGLIQQVSTTSEEAQLGSLEYIYVREKGSWRSFESYYSHDR